VDGVEGEDGLEGVEGVEGGGAGVEEEDVSGAGTQGIGSGEAGDAAAAEGDDDDDWVDAGSCTVFDSMCFRPRFSYTTRMDARRTKLTKPTIRALPMSPDTGGVGRGGRGVEEDCVA
jgi:hypothetical protein